MIRVGITGGIGSGKTVVCKIFQRLGVPVFFADDEAKVILNEDSEIKEQLKQIYGQDIYTKNGINKAKLASIIFNDLRELEKVNKLIHPKVRSRFFNWTSKYTSHPYVIEEAAVLFESGAYKDLDINVLVYASEELRIKRVMERDQVDREHVLSRMQNQMSEEEKKKLADKIINNDGEQMIIPQVLSIDEQIKNRSTHG